MMNRQLLKQLTYVLVVLVWAGPSYAITEEEAACVAAPSETCVLGLILETATAAESAAGKARIYADLGRTYGLAKRREVSQRYFAQAVAQAESIANSEHRMSALYWIGESLGRVGDWKQAVAIFRSLPDSMGWPIPMSFGAWQLADAGEFELAFEAAMRLPHPQKRPDHLRHLVRRQAEAGDITGAWKSFWAIFPGDVSDIEDLRQRFAARPKGLPVNIYFALGAIAAAEVRAGNLLAAQRLEGLRHEPQGDAFPGITAQVAVAIAEVGRVEEALAKAATIESRRGRSAALRMISERLAERQAWAEALRVAEMIDVDDQFLPAKLQVAALQAKANDVEAAIKTLDAALNPDPAEVDPSRVFFLSRLLQEERDAARLEVALALTRKGDAVAAEDHYNALLIYLPWRELDRPAISINFSHDVLDLAGKVAIARYEAGDQEGALQLISELTAFGERDRHARSNRRDFLRKLGRLHAKTGSITQALQLAFKSEYPGVRLSILRHSLKAVLASKRL